jgi:excisionase family DNA binding protein
MLGDMKTIPEVAKELGISRIAVFNKVKKGQIPSERIGRFYVIKSDIVKTLTKSTNEQQDLDLIEGAVKKVVQEYGIVLKWLSLE